jgi:predicted Zn-dependent protease
VPVLFTGEAVIELLNVLNTFAFSGRAFVEGTSFLARHRNVQVFDRGFNLCDDGTRTPGLPFPFDLEGSPKAPLDLIVDGQPSTPALTYQQGAETGLVPTAQAVGGQDALFGNLFLLPGEASEEELLAAADGGIHVGWLDRPECFDPGHLHLRARARGVRRVEGGKLGPPLPELVWEDSLLRALARLRAVGRDPVVRAVSSTPLGAISAPALVLTESEGFRVL